MTPIIAAAALSPLQTFGLFVCIPAAGFVIIAFLVYLPSIVRGPRYRPGRPWGAGSVWFGGPDDATAALSAVEESWASGGELQVSGGGASARW